MLNIHIGRTLVQSCAALRSNSAVKRSSTISEGMWNCKLPSYQEALDSLSSLITSASRVRAHSGNKGDQFARIFRHLSVLGLEDEILEMKVIHVAGTKGKGSTCAFVESIMRSLGYRTALFTSPHLIDVRERYRLDGVDISEDKFLAYFWWCWHKLKENASGDDPMPTFFRFLTLLAFKIFSAEKVDVAILEVGLGGKWDPTNVVRQPVVCGITSLGFDHMEILGNTLGEIAGEKAGIFKRGVPAITVPQPDEAMTVLVSKASELEVLGLEVARPLDPASLGGRSLGLQGDHQWINAGLAVALCRTWIHRTAGGGAGGGGPPLFPLPLPFTEGLARCELEGRGQVVRDREEPESLVFYLDGAHTPESMEVCGRWFSSRASSSSSSYNVLLFNCMSVRDPALLLPRLLETCAAEGVCFKRALFAPNVSQYSKVGWSLPPSPDDDGGDVDVSWQLHVQRVWEEEFPRHRCSDDGGRDDDDASRRLNRGSSTVFPSLPRAIQSLRDFLRRSPSLRVQVLVTGSLHMVGDVLKSVTK